MNLGMWIKEAQSSNDADSEDVKLGIILDVACGLDHIHQLGYIHGDIKPANIMIKVGESGIPEAAITDFGLCAQETERRLNLAKQGYRAGTVPYNSAPDKYYTTKFDIWSLGLLIFGLVKNEELSTHQCSDIVRTSSQQSISDKLKEELSADERRSYSELLDVCLEFNYKKRWNAERIRNRLRIPVSSEDETENMDNALQRTTMIAG